MIQLFRRADLLDGPLTHYGNSVTNRHRLFLIMGYIHSSNSQTILDFFDNIPHLNPKFGIKIRERFVHQQDIRFDGEGASQSDALLLATRKFFRHPVCIHIDFHKFHEFVCLLANGFLWHLSILKPKFNILTNIQMRENGIVLEYHTDIALCWVKFINPLVTKEEVSTFDTIEPCNHS